MLLLSTRCYSLIWICGVDDLPVFVQRDSAQQQYSMPALEDGVVGIRCLLYLGHPGIAAPSGYTTFTAVMRDAGSHWAPPFLPSLGQRV